MIVGLSGYAQSGKDSVAAILAECGFTRRAFADPLRAALYALDPLLATDAGNGPVRYSALIDRLGYESARKTVFAPEIRRLLQRLGTEVGRDLFGEDFWVDQAMRLDPGHYVFTDCRFLNEAKAIVDAGGEVWRISRPGVGPVNDHISEVGLDDWPFDRRIANDGSLTDLAEKVHSAHLSLCQRSTS